MRMKNDICGIYLITNKNTCQMYVGQSINIQKRFDEHRRVTNLGHSRIDNAINKYGAENFSFEIIMTIENDTEKLNDAEREWIAILNTYEDDFHYNLTPGGDFNPSKLPEVQAKMSEALKGRKLSEKHRKKLSEAKSGENHPWFGKKFSEEYRKKLSEARNTTGYYRVGKIKNLRCRQGFTYRYQYYDDDGKRHSIENVDIKKLEEKVKAKGLEWFKLDDDDDNIFKIQESNKILYKIEGMRPTGHFYSTRKDLNLDIHQVLKIKHRALDKDITIEKAKEIATDIGISYEILQEIAYNLTKGVFDKYIDEWQERLNKTQTNNLAIN